MLPGPAEQLLSVVALSTTRGQRLLTEFVKSSNCLLTGAGPKRTTISSLITAQATKTITIFKKMFFFFVGTSWYILGRVIQ
jgi:hypothetical protein